MRIRTSGVRAVFAAAVVLLLAAAAPVAAQQAAPPAQRNFSIAFGVGYAAVKADCGNCSPSGEENSYGEGAVYDDVAAFAVLPQWRVNSKLVAGIELQAETSRGPARAVYLLGMVRFNPWANKGFFLRGGYGLVQFKGALQLPDGTESTAKYRGMALTYGAGWMFHQNRRFAWGPYGSHYVSTLGSATIGSFQAVNIISNAWMAGIGFVFN